MKFELEKATEILRQTPYTLSRMLPGLSPEWTESTGDRGNWSPYDVIGHLIHCEETDWMPRAEIILAQDGGEFEPFDRLAQFEKPKEKSLGNLLTEFADLRNAGLEKLGRWQLTPDQLALRGVHPEFGEVTLEQLLATWVVHDLGHIRQIVGYMANKYSHAVGPWKQYLSILK